LRKWNHPFRAGKLCSNDERGIFFEKKLREAINALTETPYEMTDGANKTVPGNPVNLFETEIDGEVFYKISQVDALRPFFMSIVSDSNHWLFVASNGGISAGRKNTGYALFPYYTDDKITESAEITGSKTIVQVQRDNTWYLWEPFSERSAGRYHRTRNLYKSRWGNTIIFEEINTDLNISFQYQWSTSNNYGFVKKCKLVNLSNHTIQVRLLDGLQNLLPYGVDSALQTSTSNLADAYKRTELIPQCGLGILALSAIIVDKAEPSEALKANTAWQLGLPKPLYLLSTLQLHNFRVNGSIQQEEDIKGEKGAYFAVSEMALPSHEEKQWIIVANVNQSHAAIVQLSNSIQNDAGLYQKVLDDIKLGTENLVKLAAAADALQSTADGLKDTRHFSNVLFNIMRGGIFDDNYQIEKWDFANYLRKANHYVFEAAQPLLQQLPEVFDSHVLHKQAQQSGDMHLIRLATEYLPLKFSRRHGDPSRPWNSFSINTHSETDGSKILDYQGNWRDIFQNWEALAHAYPEFIEGMIFKFLNASTFDGYNPYRVTKDGFDWETIEPDNPWSYIGYWGDHQIIYLLKFLEFAENHRPGHIQTLLNKNGFVYAHVPYRIKPYADIVRNPKDTIEFDQKADHGIQQRMQAIGADGALLTLANGEICDAGFGEKILVTVLAKLSNLVPGGGIWMNTQRPEWNDANNALVGNGLSMVTLYYLSRFLKFFQPIFEKAGDVSMAVSAELYELFEAVANTFSQYQPFLKGEIEDAVKKEITDALGLAGSHYRNSVYDNHFSGEKQNIAAKRVLGFINDACAFLGHSIVVNKRADDLYHTYNLISYTEQGVQVSHLSEMLEGQVAVLSSGFLTAAESLKLLDALKQSSLYRQDQSSYILYPNKNLPGFLQKNNIPAQLVHTSLLLTQMLNDGDISIIQKDIDGQLHFNGAFRNAADAEAALNSLGHPHKELAQQEKALILQIFEAVFNHKEFTGRSGTFFGYEGLGSIYWHMVSKLLLAVQETCLRAIQENTDAATVNRLITHYYDINEGIGVHKRPQLYGAFPTDPYSHTPLGKGAQQPGMTGQVKEDILCRLGELGIVVQEGRLHFNPVLLRKSEFFTTERLVEYVNTKGEKQRLRPNNDALFFTYCQTPVIYQLADGEGIEIEKADGTVNKMETIMLGESESSAVFHRTGAIRRITVFLKKERLIAG
jgi:hypothetical protein